MEELEKEFFDEFGHSYELLDPRAIWNWITNHADQIGEIDYTKVLKRINECLPQNPYPEDIFPMTEKEYVERIPDPDLRTAASGFMGRFVFEATKSRFLDAIKDEFEK